MTPDFPRVRDRFGGGQARIDYYHARGKFTVREQVELLLDECSVEKYDMSVTHCAVEFVLAETKIPGDGVVG